MVDGYAKIRVHSTLPNHLTSSSVQGALLYITKVFLASVEKVITSEIVGCAVCLTTYYTVLQHAMFCKKNDYHVIHDTLLVSPSQLKTVNIYSESTGGHIFHLTELAEQ